MNKERLFACFTHQFYLQSINRSCDQFSCFVQLRPEGEAAEASSPITRKPSPPTDSCGGVNFSLISVMLHFFKLRGGASYFLPSFLSGGCNKALP